MSITITGGFSMAGGGFTVIPPPPATQTAGWWAGGRANASVVSIVDRLTYATDTATTSVRGPLSGSYYYIASAGTFTAGWFTTGEGSRTITRITYATDTDISSNRGLFFAATARGVSASSNGTTYGWFTPIGNYFNRLSYASDTTEPVLRATPASTFFMAATGTSSYGWFGGGYVSSTIVSTVQRLDYSNDGSTPTIRGPLSAAVRYHAGTGDGTTYGYYVAGNSSSTVQRITYATDTNTASIRGPFTLSINKLAGAGNDTYSWLSGAYNNTSIGRITYSTDTNTASTRGSLSAGRYALGATSGIQ
jgi:hypothetical protein